MKTPMKWATKLIAPCLIVATVACGGSSEPGPEADASKTPAQVETAIQGQDSEVLEKAVASYETAIAQLKTEAEELQDKITKAGGEMLDGILGEADDMQDEVDAKGSELIAEYDKLKAKLDDMVAKLKVYTDELASRM